MRVLVRNLRLTRGRDWLNETMDRADRTTWMCYVIAAAAAVAMAASVVLQLWS